MQFHLPTLPSSCSTSSSSGTAHTDNFAANSSSTTTPPTEEGDNDSLFGDNDSLFGEGDFPDQDILAGSGTSFEAEAENEPTLVNTAAAPRMRIALPPVLPGMAQEETVAGSSSSNEMLEEELFDLDALLRDVGWQGTEEFYSSIQVGVEESATPVSEAEPEAAVQQPATPVKRGRGRPKNTEPTPEPVKFWYRCRYGCTKHMKGTVSLRKHMMRIHGIFSNQHPTVLVHHCGRRYAPTWGGLTCNSHKAHCKTLVKGTEEWSRHHVSEPRTEQEAADTFHYSSGVQPSELVLVLPGQDEKERRMACIAALSYSDAQAAAAAAAAPQVNNGPSSAGSSQDCAIALDDEKDAECEEEDECEQGPSAKRLRM